MRDLKHLILLFGWTLIAAIPTYAVMIHAGYTPQHTYFATGGLAIAFTSPYAALLIAKRNAEATVRQLAGATG